MYKVVGDTRSRAFRVLWMLQEIDQPYEHVPCAPASDTARQYNPLGKIPALVDGNAVLTDSMAIVTYLGDKHGALTAPAGTVARAEQDAVTFWLVDELDALLWSYAKHTRILPEDMRIKDIEHGIHAEYARSLATLSVRMGDNSYLVGDTISVADILACHCLSWGFMAGMPEMPENLKTYNKHMRERPAYKRAASG